MGAIDRVSNRGQLWQPIAMEHTCDFDLANVIALLALL